MIEKLKDLGLCKQVNNRVRVVTIESVNEDAAVVYDVEETLKRENFLLKEERKTDCYSFKGYENPKGDGAFVTYFPNTKQLRVVEETACTYFTFGEPYADAKKICKPILTQTKLADYGMGYVIRLSSGKFVVIDGGRYIQEDAEELLRLLKKQNGGEMPVVALWIFSHPHSDHCRTFIALMETHANELKVERILFNFPETDDLEQYPQLKKGQDENGHHWLLDFYPMVEKTGAEVFTAHTGQSYSVGDAEFEVLSCIDDTIGLTSIVNGTAMIIMCRIAGQKILFTTDAPMSYAKAVERYGAYLKADILQVPHHGFMSGKPEAEMALYDLLKPPVVLVPVEEELEYRDSTLYRKSQRYLVTKGDYRELYTGGEHLELELPYHPAKDMRADLRERMLDGEQYCGKRAHFFMGLNTGCEEDLCITVMNSTVNVKAHIRVDLLMEDSSRSIFDLEGEVPAAGIRKLHILNEEELNPAVKIYNPHSLKLLGLPENAEFGMRVISDIPVVVMVNGRQS